MVPEEKDCEGAGNLALECNIAPPVAQVRDQEPDGRWDWEPLETRAGTMTESAAPEEENCKGAGNLAPRGQPCITSGLGM